MNANYDSDDSDDGDFQNPFAKKQKNKGRKNKTDDEVLKMFGVGKNQENDDAMLGGGAGAGFFEGLGSSGSRQAAGGLSSSFVSSGTIKADKFFDEDEDDKKSESSDSEGGFLAPANILQPVDRSRTEAGEDDDDDDDKFKLEEKPIGPSMPSVNVVSKSKMAEKYGAGYKMLAKMGFDGGGLGKNRDGIANPIQAARVRAHGEGLQESGELGSTQDLYGKKHLEKTKSAADIKKDKQNQQISKQFKKGSKKVRPIFRTAEEVKKEDVRAPAPVRIVDMTGPNARVLTSVADAIRDPELGTLKELKYNITTLIKTTEHDIRQCHQKQLEYEDLLLGKETTTTSPRHAKKKHKSGSFANEIEDENIENMKTLIEKCKNYEVENESIEAVCKFFKDLRVKYSLEFEVINCSEIGFACIFKKLKPKFKTWDCLSKPGYLVDQCEEAMDAFSVENRDRFKNCLGELVMPKFRSSLARWDVKNFEPCLQLCENWLPLLSSDCQEELLTKNVMRKLCDGVDDWNPRTDKVQINSWMSFKTLLGINLPVLEYTAFSATARLKL